MAKLGIDLGTANSCAAVVFDIRKDVAKTIMPSEADQRQMPKEGLVFPSYVAFNPNGEFLVAGSLAKSRFLKDKSDLIIRHFKRLIGRSYDYVAGQIDNRAFSEFKGRIKPSSDGSILFTIGARDISVIEVASHLLRKIVDDSQIYIQDNGEKIDSLVVTLPAAFEDKQRQDTIMAARQAGLQGIEITVIEEPTAAAIGRRLGKNDGKVMVVDVGAGTTDVIVGYLKQEQNGCQLIMTGRVTCPPKTIPSIMS